jgi:hypothetical protein
MGKQGPCYHCGVTSTPLWRNGPPDKPVLCNACGSRWRTKGTLVNYTPLHARSEADEFEDYRFSRVKTVSIKNKDAKVLKRKQFFSNGFVTSDSGNSFQKLLEEDASNKSSSGSAISNSESCVQLGNADASDVTDPAQSIVWDTTVPSRKRTCVNREKQSSVEKLTKDLYDILHEQESYFSCSSEDLLFETDTPMVSVEIGHGSMLIRHPSSIVKEEESEASSLSFDHKHHFSNQDYSQFNPHFVNNKGIEKSKKLTGFGNELEQMKREKFQHEELHNLGDNSVLCNVDPKDLLNFEELVNRITDDDRLQLLKYLANSSDNARLPDSVKRMLDDPELKEKVFSCKKMFEEGVFDISLGIKSEEFTSLKKLTHTNLTKSDWVKQYDLIKDLIRRNTVGGLVVTQNVALTAHSVNVKRSREAKFPIPGAKTTIKSPKRAQAKSTYEQKDPMENDGTCFSPKSLFALPPDNSSLMLESLKCESENSDNDLLLLDVYSNTSFPQAELLINSQPTTSSSSVYQNMIRP